MRPGPGPGTAIGSWVGCVVVPRPPARSGGCWGCRLVIRTPGRPRRAKNKRGGVHLKPQPGGVVLLSLSLWTSLSLVILLSSLSLSLSIISLPFPLPISLLAVYVARALDVRLAVIAVSCFLLVPLSVGWTLFGVYSTQHPANLRPFMRLNFVCAQLSGR